MTEEEARRFVLVRAIELEDGPQALLTREDRRHATDTGLAASSSTPARSADDRLLAARADFAHARLATRFPAVATAERSMRWRPWLGWSIPAAALIAGLVTNEIDSGARLNIIAFPLLGMLLWNLAVYALLAIRAVTGSATSGSRLLDTVATWSGRQAGRLGAQPALARALARFSADWLGHSARLQRHRTRRTFHIAAAMLAAGVIAGMYARALGVEYRAGWESTFLGPATIYRGLSLVLGPASALTGIALPDAAQLATLRWSGPGSGVNAAPWIHLYAATAALVIVVPRLMLAAWSTARAATLRRRLPLPGHEDFYVRRLLRSAHGRGALVRLIPYNFEAPAPLVARLRHLLDDVLGAGSELVVDPAIGFGEEDSWLAALRPSVATDHLLILFNLAATPEAETHGALVAGLTAAIARDKVGTAVTVLLDASAYRERLAGQAGAAARIETRRLAWERMLADQSLAPLAIGIESDEDDPALAARLEGALVREPALVPRKHSR